MQMFANVAGPTTPEVTPEPTGQVQQVAGQTEQTAQAGQEVAGSQVQTPATVIDNQQPGVLPTGEQTPPQAGQGVAGHEEQKTPEAKPIDLEKSYKFAQKKITELAQKNAELTKQMQGQSPGQQLPPTGQQQPGQGQGEAGQTVDMAKVNEALWQNAETDLYGTITGIAGAVAQQMFEQRMGQFQQQISPILNQSQEMFAQSEFVGNLKELAKPYPQLQTEEGLNNFSAAIHEIATGLGMPQLANNPNSTIMQLAAQKAFAPSNGEIYKMGLQQGQQNFTQNQQMKAGITAPTGAIPPNTSAAGLTIEQQWANDIKNAGGGRGIFRNS